LAVEGNAAVQVQTEGKGSPKWNHLFHPEE
jgi:hypothetical protein